MTRLILFFIGVLAAAIGFSWLADNPGTITVDWLGYRAEPTVFQAVVGFAVAVIAVAFTWSLLRQIWNSPATFGHYLMRRRQKRGLDALSSGMIAVGAGDKANATRYAIQARKSLPNEPLTHLLRAQAAQLSGDRATARRIFEAMLSSPDTEQLGLRGLYLEAKREGEPEAEGQFAQRALRLNPKLAWPAEALFDLQCKQGRWGDALETLASAHKYGQIDKHAADRRRAVLLTARAQELEEQNPDTALSLALEAHGLAPDLTPAAAIAGRIYAGRGSTAKAAKVIQKTWAKFPHPDLATAYAFARIGDSPRDRLDRVKQLAALNPHSPESGIAVAKAAIEAKAYGEARHALSPLAEDRLTRRVAALMARIESEQHGDKGRVREWLARAVNAPRDPAWTADGVVAEDWSAISPVTGALDAFKWRVPVEEADVDTADIQSLAVRLDELDALGDAGPSVALAESSPASTAVVAAPHADEPVIDAEAVDVEVAEPPVPEPAPATRSAAETDVAPPAGAAATATAASEAEAVPVRKKPSRTPAKKSKSEKTQSTKSFKSHREPKIFVAPPAPDDPGAEEETDDLTLPLKPYRASS